MPMPIVPNGETADEKPRSTVDSINMDMLNYQGHSQMFDYALGNKVTNKHAKNLFKIWNNKDGVISAASSQMKGKEDDVYAVPKEMLNHDVISLKSAGLIDGGGKTVRFTEQGKEVIKNIILFGEQSSFDKEEMPLYTEIERRIQDNMQKKSGKKRQG